MKVIETEMFSLNDSRLGFNLMHFTSLRKHLGLYNHKLFGHFQVVHMSTRFSYNRVDMSRSALPGKVVLLMVVG